YARPHSNLTEIQEGLDLLWRNNISPSKVVLGLAWYGRSFSLANPSCTTPGCVFTAGGNPVPQVDSVAAVNWVTWGGDQWVSYDNGQTMQLKIQAANILCLGGTMVWAFDHDNLEGDSVSLLLGLDTSQGVDPDDALTLKKWIKKSDFQAQAQALCYWTGCDEECDVRYFPETWSSGQPKNVPPSNQCTAGFRTLCCAASTSMGRCAWEGWRGVGMRYTRSVCQNPDAVWIAGSSTSLQLIPASKSPALIINSEPRVRESRRRCHERPDLQR
ncbi:hypothetical protein P152DRAFT_397522, partial [Eremomyces bilateralis CBS 781.70]